MSTKTSDRRRTKRSTMTWQRQAAKGIAARAWLAECAAAAEKRVKAARKARDERRAEAIAEAVINGTLPPARTFTPVHDYPVEQHPVTGRWVRQPYRNPDRAARLAKSGRLRAELR